jgi:hypothetical protein
MMYELDDERLTRAWQDVNGGLRSLGIYEHGISGESFRNDRRSRVRLLKMWEIAFISEPGASISVSDEDVSADPALFDPHQFLTRINNLLSMNGDFA